MLEPILVGVVVFLVFDYADAPNWLILLATVLSAAATVFFARRSSPDIESMSSTIKTSNDEEVNPDNHDSADGVSEEQTRD